MIKTKSLNQVITVKVSPHTGDETFMNSKDNGKITMP
jgi:hypothetical protein